MHSPLEKILAVAQWLEAHQTGVFIIITAMLLAIIGRMRLRRTRP